MAGVYKANEILYPFTIGGVITGRIHLYASDNWSEELLNQCSNDLEKIVCLTEPKFYEKWTVGQEFLRQIVPFSESFQPYWYFQSLDFKSNKEEVFIFESEDSYYDKLYEQAPEISLPNNLRLKTKGHRFMLFKTLDDYYYGLPFLLVERKKEFLCEGQNKQASTFVRKTPTTFVY